MRNQPDTSLFPLPLVTFEEYMFLDDRPAYPANIFVRLRFSGHLERSALKAALLAAFSSHPLLHALVRRSDRGTLEWVAAGDRQPILCWDREEGPSTVTFPPRIDLLRETGLRISSAKQLPIPRC